MIRSTIVLDQSTGDGMLITGHIGVAPEVQMNTRAAILVIDDEPGIREMLSYELSQEGFDVETAESGLAAVQAVKRRKFDLAVTDLKMPGMDGVATVEALRSLDPDIEVIVATGYATVETAIACMKNGAYDYIQKPYDLTELTLLLDRAMQKSHLQGVVALYEASHALLATLHHSDLIHLVLTLTQRVLPGDETGLVLTRSDGSGADVHRLQSGVGLPDDLLVELATRATRERSPLRLPSKVSDPGSTPCAALAYPLVTKDRTLGALVVVRRDAERLFSASELQKGTVFANQLALALDNARLYENLEAKIVELIATREHLVQAEKLALAGHLAGAIAHEVNNPLSFVRANLDAIRDYSSTVGSLWLAAKAAAVYLRGQRDPVADGHAERLCNAGGVEERTDHLVRDIAEIVDETLEGVKRIAELVAGFKHLASRAESGSPQEVEVTELVKECIAALPEAESRLRLLPALGPLLTFCRRDDLRTALLNLMAHLSALQPSRMDTAITVRVETSEGRPSISFTDTGLDLSDDERRRIFDPKLELSTLHGRTLRLNLSLALSCQLIHRNGGEISVSGTDGTGAVFRVVLPRAGDSR